MPPSTGVSITNPLVLYRSLVSTNRIKADPGQHRLAIQLSKLYEKIKDHQPTVDYHSQLSQLNRVLQQSTENGAQPEPRPRGGLGLWKSLLAEKDRRETLALTRSLTEHDAAMSVDAPLGLLVHGSVGTGKSMLIDLFSECLPTKRKKRYHYSTFMLDVVSKLEVLRRQRLASGNPAAEEHSMLWLARDLIETSPILFLDEFQLPDRMAAKTVSALLTCFFRLGGVLIATSNRLPDELAKAAGIDYAASGMSGGSFGSWFNRGGGKSSGMFAGQGEFVDFLELLKKRCEIYEMEGKSDYRRDGKGRPISLASEEIDMIETVAAEPMDEANQNTTAPSKYFVEVPDSRLNYDLVTIELLQSVAPKEVLHPWGSSTVLVYGRKLHIPRTKNGISAWTFDELCMATLGPADYVTLASTFHTFIIINIPVLTSTLKNEARRFITLLDALYEARCKLIISASAAPDDLFFPELRPNTTTPMENADVDDDALHAETFAEIHQDLTSPFRPNISSYALADDALEDDPPNKIRRAALGEMTEQERIERIDALGRRDGPNFAQASSFIGEDERFAYKRAISRLWEMCGERWWSRQQEGWWRPLGKDVRHWERSTTGHESTKQVQKHSLNSKEFVDTSQDVNEELDEVMFRHGASPLEYIQNHHQRYQMIMSGE